MKDQTLTSDTYNNLKFNMQKLILDVPEEDAERLSQIFNAPLDECQTLLLEFRQTVLSQVEILKKEYGIPQVNHDVTVAFIGDSITSDRESYLNILKKLYESEPKIQFVDASVSGDKSDDAIMKFYLRALNYNPDIVHILIGTNDLRRNNDKFGKNSVSLEEYERNLDYMVHTLKERKTKVVLSTISPVIVERLNKRFPDDNWTYAQDDIDRCNEIIENTARKYDVKLNDMRKVYKQHKPEEILLQDGLHLNCIGQRLLTHHVLETIKEYF